LLIVFVRIVSNLAQDVERPFVAAHCLMQNASSASRPLVLIDDRRPATAVRRSRNETFAIAFVRNKDRNISGEPVEHATLKSTFAHRHRAFYGPPSEDEHREPCCSPVSQGVDCKSR